MASVIRTFRHKGLRDLHATGSRKGVPARPAVKLMDMLDMLDAATRPEDMGFPGSGLHPLKGDMAGLWSVKVTGNVRLVFRMKEGDAYDVELVDYH